MEVTCGDGSEFQGFPGEEAKRARDNYSGTGTVATNDEDIND